MIPPDARPRIASCARLKLDHRSGRHVLLYPERGLLLNGTAAEIVRRCRGDETVREIADALARAHAGTPRAIIAAELESFLGALRARCILEIE